jgi:hypothetical protein
MQARKGVHLRIFFDATDMVFFFANNPVTVANAVTHNLQEVQAEVMRGVEHGESDVCFHDKKSTFFFGENLGTGPHVVKDGHGQGTGFLGHQADVPAELQQFLVPELDPLGRKIIECCLSDGKLEDYLALTPMKNK